MDKSEDSSPIFTTLPPLGEGLPLKLEPREPPPARDVPTRTRSRAHLRMEEPEVITTLKGDPPIIPNPSYCATGSSSTATTIGILSPPPTPPRLTPRSPAVSRRSSGRLQSMDDSYCDRIRSTSSFGWYEESAAFESIDVPSSAFCQIEDWRNLETWDGGRQPVPRQEVEEEALEVEFEVPNAHVTTTKTFRHANHGRPEPYAVAIGATRVIRMSAHSSHAEYQVLMSTKDKVHKTWKRFSDFKLLAEYAKISDLRESVAAWRNIQQTQRWFRCLEANYLKTKCMLLEKFLAELLFEVPTPALLLTFVGAQQPDFTRRR